MIVSVNIVAVLVAAVAAFAIGGFWYSPAGFGKAWMKLRGKDPHSMDGMKMPMGRMVQEFIATLITAFLIAQFAAWVGAVGVQAGLMLGFWIWLGFYATTMYGQVLWEEAPLKLYFINVGLRLVNLLVMATIIVMWR